MSDGMADFTWPEPPDPNEPCAYAQEFDAFCQALLRHVEETPAQRLELALAEAKLNLIDRYCDYLTDTPASHTNAAGRRKHRCITEVLQDTIRTLRLVQRSRMPPRLGYGQADPPRQPRFGLPIRDPE